MKTIMQAREMELKALKARWIAGLLLEMGYESTAADVTIHDYERHANWLLEHTRKQIRRTDPVTRESWNDPEYDRIYNEMKSLVEKLLSL